MKVIDHLNQAKSPLISFEIIPPLRGGNICELEVVVKDLAQFKPPFIDVTSHAAEVTYEETTNEIRRLVSRKRPGTLGICALIQHKYHIDAIPHLLCRGFTREETEDLLIDLNYTGIENVFAIRGDEHNFKKPLAPGKTINKYASNLVQQITFMNQGHYLNESESQTTSFCIGAACYPEKHAESPNLETDIEFLKKKIASGTDYLVTQMFFDNSKYFTFLEQCRNAGITIPIIPGLKVITKKSHLTTLPNIFRTNIPYQLSKEIASAKPDHITNIGIEWAYTQVQELLNHNVPAVHFYVMQDSLTINKILKKIGF